MPGSVAAGEAALRLVGTMETRPASIQPRRRRSADFGSSSRLNASACQGKFSTKLIVWNVSFFLAMPHFEGDEPPGL